VRHPRNQAGFTLIELMIAVAIAALLAAIAIPTFMRYQARSRQAEGRTNLGAIFVSETAFFAGSGRYSGIPEIAFTLAGTTNRYTYRSVSTDANGAATPQPGDTINAAVGTVEAEGVPAAASSTTGFTATAAGNLDNDPTVDQWHVNDVKQGLQVADQNDALN